MNITPEVRARIQEIHRRYTELKNAGARTEFARECGEKFCDAAIPILKEVRNDEDKLWALTPQVRSGLVESCNLMDRFRQECIYAKGQGTEYPEAPSVRVFEVLNALFQS